MDAGRVSEYVKGPATLSSLLPLLPARLHELTDERVTEVVYLDGGYLFIHDTWTDSSCHRSQGKKRGWPNRLLPKGRR